MLELFVEGFSPDLQTRIRRMIDCGEEATEQARGKPGGKAVGEQDQVGDRRDEEEEAEDKEALIREVVFGGRHSLSVTVRNKIRGRREEESRREEEGRKKVEKIKEQERIQKEDGKEEGEIIKIMMDEEGVRREHGWSVEKVEEVCIVKRNEGRSSKLGLAMKPRRHSAPARRNLKMTAVRRIVELEAREMVRRAVIERLVEDAVTRLAEGAASHEDEGVKNEAVFDAYG